MTFAGSFDRGGGSFDRAGSGSFDRREGSGGFDRPGGFDRDNRGASGRGGREGGFGGERREGGKLHGIVFAVRQCSHKLVSCSALVAAALGRVHALLRLIRIASHVLFTALTSYVFERCGPIRK